jgi:hypothetical protein
MPVLQVGSDAEATATRHTSGISRPILPSFAAAQFGDEALVVLYPAGQAAQRDPPPKKKTRVYLPQAPTKRGVCASLPAALLPVGATHVATAPSTPADISAKPPAVARPTGV